jgi:hypothetical protein
MLSNISVHYCAQNDTPNSANRIVPGPKLSIQPELYYANDNVVGYTYNITLNGYADALRLDKNDRPVGERDYGVDQVVGHIDDIRKLFNFNGGNLHVMDGGNKTILVAKGSTIKSMNFNESDNKWVNYAPYSIEIEFNEVDFRGCSSAEVIGCDQSIFHTPVQTGVGMINNNLIDMRSYRVKEFKDNWSFTIEDQIYDNFGSMDNSQFKVSYSLSATGKNYYTDGKTLPAWLQAKNFVQNKLQKQIKGLIGGILTISANESCSASLTLDQLHAIDLTHSSGMMSGLIIPPNDGTPNYCIYNEVIKCDTSESDGSFGITYDAILKKYNPVLNPRENAVQHTFSKTINYTDDSENNTTIAVQGTVQGLIMGGFIYIDFNDFQLPSSGSFIAKKDGFETKYYNAFSAFESRIGNNTDLLDSFKTTLSIDSTALSIKGAAKPVKPSSFSLDHNYHDGNIQYTANYDKKTATQNARGYSNITIVRRDPVEMTQEFVVPGRAAGPIIQKLNMRSSRTISVNIEGASDDNMGCCPPKASELAVCDSLPVTNIPNLDKLIDKNNPKWILTKEDYTTNKVDGSFSINLEYLCRSDP